MRILLSAYACHPYEGSESGIGWNFAKELASKGYEVYILTKNPSKEIAFRKEISRLNLQGNLFVLYYDLPPFIQKFYRAATAAEHVYYLLWQAGAYFFAKDLVKKIEFDIVHHITLGVFRTPSFMHLLGKPFVFGPVGGGEECPPALRKNLPFGFKLKEIARSVVNRASGFDPFLNQCLKNSDLILLKTSDNLRFIPDSYHAKCQVELEVGIQSLPKPDKREKLTSGKVKILFAGRLIYWKGLHLAIKAFAGISGKFPEVEFTVVGSGPDEDWLKSVAVHEGVSNKINWVPRVDRAVLFEMYRDFDLLLFPSLHDSSGGVVLEALSFGIPVVCLDLGGPKEIVDESCSVVVKTKSLTETEVVKNLSFALENLITKPEKMALMREHAMEKAGNYTWEKVVGRVYRRIEEIVLDVHLIS